MESATENNRLLNLILGVRVKTYGKSVRPGIAIYYGGQTLSGARQNRHVLVFVPEKHAGMSQRYMVAIPNVSL